jgi:hypothetical protein
MEYKSNLNWQSMAITTELSANKQASSCLEGNKGKQVIGKCARLCGWVT